MKSGNIFDFINAPYNSYSERHKKDYHLDL